MSVILNQITIGDNRIILVDSAPNLGSGLTAEIGSIVMIKGQAGIFLKTGPNSTDWKLSTVDAAQLGLDLDDIQSQIDAEVEARESLSARVDQLDNGNDELLAQEIARAQAAEASLQESLDQEVSNRVADVNAEEARALLAESGLQSQITQEISDRQSDVNAEESRALLAESALQSAIDQEISDRQSAVSDLSLDLDNLDGYAQDVRSDLDQELLDRATADSGLQSQITQEIADRQSGDTSTLSSAQNYTDQKVADLVNSAPAVLDTLKELSDALGGDANFATTIAGQIGAVDDKVDQEILDRIADVNAEESRALLAESGLQSQISQEILDRQSADNASDLRLLTLEAFKNSNLVHVSKSGSDVTGTGGQHKPFASVAAALASITDASPNKRYAIKVEAGAYTETNLALKANVFIMGDQKEATRITASSLTLASDFSGSADNRSGMARLSILTANPNFDWASVTSAAGKLYFAEVSFGGSVTLKGHNNAIAQAMFDSCVFFSNFTVSGINIGIHTNNFHYGNINLNQHPNGGMATILNASGGQCNGTVTLTASVNDFNRRCSLFSKNFYMEYITVNGPSAYVDMNEGSLPRSRDRIVSQNGGNIVYITTKTPHITNSVNIGEPGYQYLYNFSYVHASTDTDLYVISMGAAYSAANTGRSIFIEADSYGLNADVNGGDINLTTATTSGSGVRGKIKLDGKEIDVTSKKITNLADGTNASDAINKSQLDGLSTSLSADIDAEESRALAAESTLQSAIDQEILDRQSGDSSTLSSAQSYTDQKVADLVNSAPTVLDTLKELSDALGSDPNFATTIAGQIGDLDSRLDTLEGSDTTEGSVAKAEKDAKDYADGIVAAEESARQAADSAEASARQAADDALDARVLPIEKRYQVNHLAIYENNAQVYADGQPGVEDPSGQLRDGWYYTNVSAGQKINWYYFDGINNATVTLGDLSAYAVMTFDGLGSMPILGVYTKPTGSGDVIPGFAHSRVAYSGSPTGLVTGKKYLVYFGENPSVHPELPRVQLVKSTGSSAGDQNAAEEVLTVSFGSNSGASVGSVKFMTESLGIWSASYKHEVELRIRHASQLSLNNEITARIADVNAEESRALAAEAELLKLDGSRAMAGDLNMTNHYITSVGKLGLGSGAPETKFHMEEYGVKFNMSAGSNTTSGAEAQVVETLAIADDSVEMVKILVTGMDSASKDSVSYERTARIKNVGGTVTLGAVQSDYTSEDSSLSGANCAFVVDAGGVVNVQVTGVAAKNMIWKCVMHRMR